MTAWRLLLTAWLISTGCGLIGDPADPGDIERRVEVVIESDEGLEEAVRIDSLAWRPTFLDFGFEEELQEFEGTFDARFANLTDQPLQIRYDLRFYDRYDDLVDDFIPFGQPVRLDPHQVRRVESDFFLRAGDPRDLEQLTTMRLFARVMKPE